MKELAPQTKDGSYSRPTYNLKGVIGSPDFPVRPSLHAVAAHPNVCTIRRKIIAFISCGTMLHQSHCSSGMYLVIRITMSFHSVQLAAHLLFLLFACLDCRTDSELSASWSLRDYICYRWQSGRYHVYVGNACPWCHRVLLALIVRGLLPHISYTIAADDPERASRGGWVFDTPEPVFGRNDLR